MSQVFHRSFNVYSKASIVGVVLLAGLAGGGLYALAKSDYMTNVGLAREQPVPFSHQHHVRDLGIDCRYCHTSVEDSAVSGVPPTKTCMNCHSQIWLGSTMLEPVRASFRSGESIEWNRVHRLAHFVYFNHSIHVAKGMSCMVCHGDVDRMPLLRQHGALTMEWCLECHNDPQKYVRPREEIFNIDYNLGDLARSSLVEKYGFKVKQLKHEAGEHKDEHPVLTQQEVGAKLKESYQIRNLITCSTCHR